MASSARVHGLLYEMKNLDKSYSLNSPSPTEGGELTVLKKINAYIVEQGGPIDVVVGRHRFKGVYGANKVEGTPKADIVLVCYNKKTGKFYDACFISHKAGRDASGFQQYSGITPKADGSKAGSISRDKNVINFLKTLSKLHESVVQQKQRYYTVVEDKALIGKSIYGPMFGASSFGVDNIHLIGQGEPVFRKRGKEHELFFSAHTSLNPDVSAFKRQDYTTILGARFSSGRNYEVGGKTYSGVRVLIMPQRLIGSKAIQI